MEDPNSDLEKLENKLPSQDQNENYGQPPPQGDGRKVFIGNLGLNVDKETLAKHFEKFGKVEEIDMRGRFAFVNFADHQSANEAVKGMHNEFIGDQQIVCQHHQPSTRNRRPGLFGGRKRETGGFYKRGRTQHRVIVRSLDPRCTWQNLKDFGRTAGDVNFANVYTYEGKKIGVIEYNAPESQSCALAELPNRLLNDRHVQVEEDFGQFDHLTQPRKRDRSPYMFHNNHRTEHRSREDYKYRYENTPTRSYHNYERHSSPTFYSNSYRMTNTSSRHHPTAHEDGRMARSPHQFYDHEHRIDDHPRMTERPAYEETGRYRSNEPRHSSNTHHQHYYHGESPTSNPMRPPSLSRNMTNYKNTRDPHTRGQRYYSNSMDSPKRTTADNYYSDRNMNMENTRFNERSSTNWPKSRPSKEDYSPDNRYDYGQTHSRGPREDTRRHEIPSDRSRYDDFSRFGGEKIKPTVLMKDWNRGHMRRDRSKSPNMRYNDRRLR